MTDYNKRNHLRRIFNRSIHLLEQHITKKDVTNSIIELEYLRENYALIQEQDRIIQAELLKKYQEDVYTAEMDEAEDYRRKFIKFKHVTDELVQSRFNANEGNNNTSKNTLKLPKIEMKKFDDDPRNWLSFWGQFKKIDRDENLCAEDKFQYLLQNLKEGSSARTLVESFPPSAENYKKAVEQLKARFGKEDTLIQVYVRELLTLVISQQTSLLSLKDLYDKLSTYLLSLETLGITESKYETILYPLVESALPESILVVWNRSTVTKQLAPMLDFLKREVESEESIRMARSDFSNLGNPSTNNYIQRSNPESNMPTAACIISNARTEKQGKDPQCCFCNKTNHNVFQCGKANKMSLEQKKKAIRESGCCYICLKQGHIASKCRNFVKCIACNKRHYVFVCPQVHKSNDREENVLLSHKTNNETLLQTLIVKITYNGKWKKVRALLDSGSQRSYIKSSVAAEMKLKLVGTENVSHTVFGGEVKTAKVHKCFEIQVSNLNNSFETKIIALEQSNICGHLPKVRDDILLKKIKSQNIEISDIYSTDTEIGLLIGSDYLGSIMTNNLVSFDNNLVGLETKLGWTLQGPIKNNATVTNTCLSVLNVSQSDISNLWNIELLGIQDPYGRKSKEVLEFEMLKCFNDNISVNADERYEVALLWKEGCPEPSTNYDVARKRLDSTTKKLLSTGNLHNYCKILHEWKNEGIICEVENDIKEHGHYLPHHAVIKDSSSTTRVRPVFDASAKDQKGISLNDCISKGVNLIELIPKLLILFRQGAYGVTADIAKAFLQISVCESDRNYMKFLWWKDPEKRDEVVTYKHNRVVFGVNCSPFLLSATINYHLDHCQNKYAQTAAKLKTSFYVDNCITSFDTRNELETFILQSKEIMALAKFDLRGWVTAPERKDISDVPVLGMTWNTKDDELFCSFNTDHSTGQKITKRHILSVTQKIFDPLGLLCPATVTPKHILQRIWEKKYDWDEEIAADLAREFKQWLSMVHLLPKCKIPRRLTVSLLAQTNTSLHTFCDACEYAYAACVYLRTEHNGNVHTQLVLAKSRIAPANKKMSLPRLELMGAVIASRLYNEVIKSGLLAKCKNYKDYFWTDSTVVIAWLKQQKEWKSFVSNRVKEIQQNTNINSWRHLPGECNPADLPSRGCNAKKLMDSRWWEGPAWLRRHVDDWPTSRAVENTLLEESVKREEKQQTAVHLDHVSPPFSGSLMYFSKYSKIVRLVAWILRLHPRVRKQFNRTSNISTEEYLYAEKTLIKLLQREHFVEGSLPNSLNTKEDDEGIIRVKTRLELSQECREFVNPILLPGKNVVVQRLVRQRHEHLKHAGTQLLLSELRNDFWILNIRRLAKKTISECVVCRRYKSKHYEIPEAPLPSDRIESITAFQTSGVDFAGPLILQNGEKCWIALFTCATYRAIHLELVESLSTNSFLMALRRFIARRGRVCTIYSDNGTNFQGAANALNKIDWTEVEAATGCMLRPVKWKFIVPAAPWWGGWWERLVRVVKEILRRVLGKASVTWVELATILCDVEAVINGRPLTYVATDDNSLRPLTPSMFLHGLPNAETADLDLIDARSANIRYRYMEKLRSDFRQRFRNEYISLLVSRNRCKSIHPAVGDVVLVEADSGRLHWPLGIIKELVAGTDGRARVARVQTATGEKLRACQRLYPLEVSADAEAWPRAATDYGRGTTEDNDLLSNSSCALEREAPHRSDETPIHPVSSGSQPFSATTRHGRVVKIPRRFLD